ncbi:MAG: hypothetical protein Q4D38_01130 [Planctomycetia bacterium]|nr:hypothetical protein [Planctomycetia bacterium]
MKTLIQRIVREEGGVLTFEWILLITVLVIGIVGGLSAVRDAYNYELGCVSQAIVSLDLSYWINAPIQVLITAEGTDIQDHLSGTATYSIYEQVLADVEMLRPTVDMTADPKQHPWGVTGGTGDTGDTGG